MILTKIAWFFFIFLAVSVGVYPLAYLFFDMSNGLLGTKPADLFQNKLWETLFYIHLAFGGIALFTGWPQFLSRLRNKHVQVHRSVGSIYILSAFIGGFTALYIALYATGGMVSMLGFEALGLLWLGTTAKAYTSIRNKDITSHKQWMIRSYALCFAAVTLRIWMPIFLGLMQQPFIESYRIIAWLSWVPNLVVAEILIRTTAIGTYQEPLPLKEGKVVTAITNPLPME